MALLMLLMLLGLLRMLLLVLLMLGELLMLRMLVLWVLLMLMLLSRSGLRNLLLVRLLGIGMAVKSVLLHGRGVGRILHRPAGLDGVVRAGSPIPIVLLQGLGRPGRGDASRV